MGIILASSSPRRKKILEKLGYNFIIKVPNINEDNTSKLNPIDYVIDVSMRKGLKVHQQYGNAFVLSGDTIVEFQNEIIGKPSLPLPTTTTFELGDSANLLVASIPLILRRLVVKLLLTILLASASPLASILFLSASLFSLSSLYW